jgi:hypothetical protein
MSTLMCESNTNDFKTTWLLPCVFSLPSPLQPKPHKLSQLDGLPARRGRRVGMAHFPNNKSEVASLMHACLHLTTRKHNSSSTSHWTYIRTHNGDLSTSCETFASTTGGFHLPCFPQHAEASNPIPAKRPKTANGTTAATTLKHQKGHRSDKRCEEHLFCPSVAPTNAEAKP